MLKIAPSLLSADFTRLGEEIDDVTAAGADWLHIDVMDGQFVPNISIGLPVLKSVRAATRLPLDVHLMICRPGKYVRRFCEAGADWLSFHVEAEEEKAVADCICEIRAMGKKAGLVIKPETEIAAVMPWLEQIDCITVMTVEPGFGGQEFMADMLPKIRELRAMRDAFGLPFLLEADGGVNVETARMLAEAGADVLVAGSAVFGHPDRAAAIDALRGGKEA